MALIEAKLVRSSQFAERSFYPSCGSKLGMREEVLGDRVQVCIGSLDEPGRVQIQDRVWTSSRVSWFDTNDDLPRFLKVFIAGWRGPFPPQDLCV
jgi:hypothetical protein